MTNRVGIDVRTSDAIKLVRRLGRLVGTVSVRGPHPYRHVANCAQLHYVGNMDEAQLDAWLYRTKHGAEYEGTFPMVEEA